MIFPLVAVVAIIVLDFFIAKQFERIAQYKGYNGKKYFHWCFWFATVGYLMVIALPTLDAETAARVAQIDQARKSKAPAEPEFKSGTCQMCSATSDQLTYCKIEDNLGIRYRDLCPECAKNLNATNV